MPQTRHVASTSTGLHPTLRWLKGKGARGGAYEGANNDSRASACEGANDGCSGQGPAAPAVRPTGLLTSATKKGRPTGEWGRMTTMVPMMVPAGTPTMAAAAKVPAAPATGLVGALASAAKKGG
jgi:hypothetical protein